MRVVLGNSSQHDAQKNQSLSDCGWELSTVSVKRVYAAGDALTCLVEVQTEHSVEIAINGIPAFKVICSPDNVIDLVLGRLLTEGIIEGIDDVDMLYISNDASSVQVSLKELQTRFGQAGPEVIATYGSKGSISCQQFVSKAHIGKVTPIKWQKEWIFALARCFAEDSPMHKRTCGAHSCYLALGGDIVFRREDLGRHNAFDKVIGAALQADVDLAHTILFSSGRIPVDMIQKAISAKVPILATKAVPTDATIQLAHEHDLTLICQARPDSFCVYNDPLNIMLL